MATIAVNASHYPMSDMPAHMSLAQFLRETVGLTGTKEGCASGDCGACTVILRNADGSDAHNINSCITPVGAAIGKQVITVEGVGTPQAMHPVQQAMVDEHGSQCGFCTPGFVMSMVAAQLRTAPTSANEDEDEVRACAIEAVSGNLCRCTGYRPIIDAALKANQQVTTDPARLLPQTSDPGYAPTRHYTRPQNLAELQALLKGAGFTRTLAGEPNTDHWLISGGTDAFLEVTQRYLDPVTIVDLGDVAEMRGIAVDTNNQALALGAATTHTEALQWFSTPGRFHSPAIISVLQRFGSPQIRSRGTLGGNIANASPIADWPPLLLALDAELTLVNLQNRQRRVRISEFYHDYKRTALGDEELVLSVHIPAQSELANLSAHKISKRFEDDISTTMGSLYLSEVNGKIDQCRIGFGGVAAIPLRCTTAEQALVGQTLTPALIENALTALGHDITPISDVRASADYRRAASTALLRNLLQQRLGGADQ